MHRSSIALALGLLVACSDEQRQDPTEASAGNAVVAAGGTPGSTGAGSGGGEGDGGAGTGTGAGGGGGEASGWRTLAPLPGGPRQETAVVALDGEVWVMGGFDGVGNVVDTVEILDPATNTWRAGPPLPTPMHHANAVVVQGRLLILGFLVQVTFSARGDGFAWDPEAEEWIELATLGRPRGASAVGAIDQRAIVCGGFREGAVVECDVYDAADDEWAALPDLPLVRDHVVGAVVDDRFFVIGGREGTIESIGGQVWELDLDQGTFEPRESMLTARAGCASAVLEGQVLVAGGEGNVSSPAGVFSELEAYDVEDDAWYQLPPMPTPRHGTGAAVANGMLIVPGGADAAAFAAVDVVEAYLP